MKYCMRFLTVGSAIFLSWLSDVLAQSGEDPKAVVDTFSTKMIEILKGPIAKVLAVVILLACVGSLLRGRHKVAISCGIAFIVLLFLQMLS
jgi:type IV secretory pathway VirB2 component (pilin)